MVREWALKADKLLCYEHVGEKTLKPHVHLLLIRVSCTTERLKQLAAPWVPVGISGNALWSFKTKSKDLGPVSEETSRKYVIYMTKGAFRPSYNKGYEEAFLEACKDSWMVKEDEESRDELLYRAFEDKIWEYYNADRLNEEFRPGTTIFEHDQSAVVERLARSWSLAAHKRIWNVRTASDAKMVYLTYCYRYGVSIPQSVKTW